MNSVFENGGNGFLFSCTLQCFNILAWPILALCYPLYVSVHTIERSSNSDIAKMITYWVCFSLILLLEHSFHSLLRWLPYRPYMKLIIVGRLVILCFDGSYYIYNRIVRPCLSVNPRIVFILFIKVFELTSKRDIPRIETKRERNEIQPQDQQNVVAFKRERNAILLGLKPDMVEGPKVNVFAANSAETLDYTKYSQALWSCALCKDKNDNISHHKSERHSVAHGIQKMETKWRIKDIVSNSPSKKVPQYEAVNPKIGSLTEVRESKKWCNICNVRCSGEGNMKQHLKGRKHLAKTMKQSGGAPAIG